MAYVKCSGGGKLKETILWTNPDTSKSFSNQTITLSQSFTNFDYLKIIFIYSTTNTTEFDGIWSVAGINRLAEFRSNSNIVIGSMFFIGGWVYRNFGYDNNGDFIISSCANASSTSYSNTKMIPKQIIGLK